MYIWLIFNHIWHSYLALFYYTFNTLIVITPQFSSDKCDQAKIKSYLYGLFCKGDTQPYQCRTVEQLGNNKPCISRINKASPQHILNLTVFFIISCERNYLLREEVTYNLISRIF